MREGEADPSLHNKFTIHIHEIMFCVHPCMKMIQSEPFEFLITAAEHNQIVKYFKHVVPSHWCTHHEHKNKKAWIKKTLEPTSMSNTFSWALSVHLRFHMNVQIKFTFWIKLKFIQYSFYKWGMQTLPNDQAQIV